MARCRATVADPGKAGLHALDPAHGLIASWASRWRTAEADARARDAARSEFPRGRFRAAPARQWSVGLRDFAGPPGRCPDCTCCPPRGDAPGGAARPGSGTPHVRFSVARRTISSTSPSSNGGRPGDRGWVHFLATMRWLPQQRAWGDDPVQPQRFRQHPGQRCELPGQSIRVAPSGWHAARPRPQVKEDWQRRQLWFFLRDLHRVRGP